jgi:divalent metal cation (Fe/Co/Zn/Cd) transporter
MPPTVVDTREALPDPASPQGTEAFTSRRSMTVGMVVAVAQTAALAAAAVVTGSAALKTQTATNLADVAVSAFLLIGVVSSNRPADNAHPLGYGRERSFWSFVAAVGILAGGVGAAVAETLQAVFHPQPTGAGQGVNDTRTTATMTLPTTVCRTRHTATALIAEKRQRQR